MRPTLIVKLSIVAVVFLTIFVIIKLTVEKPLVKLRPLKQRNFGLGVLANILVGVALFGSVYCVFRIISGRCSTTTPSRSAMCLRKQDCRSYC